MIKFVTESGSAYYLDLETDILTRDGVQPLKNVYDGHNMAEPTGDKVYYERPPTVGESFEYIHPTLHGCISTPVVSIEELAFEE